MCFGEHTLMCVPSVCHINPPCIESCEETQMVLVDKTHMLAFIVALI